MFLLAVAKALELPAGHQDRGEEQDGDEAAGQASLREGGGGGPGQGPPLSTTIACPRYRTTRSARPPRPRRRARGPLACGSRIGPDEGHLKVLSVSIPSKVPVRAPIVSVPVASDHDSGMVAKAPDS